MNVILVTGGREYQNESVITKALLPFANKEVLLIHGNCRGADTLAGQVGTRLGFKIASRSPDWKTFGKAAGPRRNMEMVQELLNYQKSGSEIHVFAFHDDLAHSKGTKHCIEYAVENGLKILVHEKESVYEYGKKLSS